MNLTKNLLVALRTLPKRYVADGTMAVEYGPQPGCVFVINGLKGLPAICHYPKLKAWKRVKFVSAPTVIHGVTNEGVPVGAGRPASVIIPASIQPIKP